MAATLATSMSMPTSADRGSGAADRHRRQREQDLWSGGRACRSGIHRRRPAEQRDHRQRHPDQPRRTGHGQPRWQPLYDHPEQRHGRNLYRWQLHDHLRRWQADRESRAADRHRQQREQDLRPDADTGRYRLHLQRSAEQRDHRQRHPDQRWRTGHGQRRRQPLHDHPEQRQRWNLHRRQLQHHVCQRCAHRKSRAADRHGQQREQDLWANARPCRNRLHRERAAEQRDHRQRHRDQRWHCCHGRSRRLRHHAE